MKLRTTSNLPTGVDEEARVTLEDQEIYFSRSFGGFVGRSPYRFTDASVVASAGGELVVGQSVAKFVLERGRARTVGLLVTTPMLYVDRLEVEAV